MYNGLQQYKKIMVNTGSPVENIVLLYKKCIQSMVYAEQKIQEDNLAAKGKAIITAIDIINVLNNNLDFSQGEVANRLNESYQIILAHLTEANFKNDVSSLQLAREWLTDLLTSWEKIAKTKQ